MESKDAVGALGALAQERRLAIYRALVRAGPAGLTVGAINAAVGIAPATLSFHLKELAHAGLVESRANGRFVHYSASFERMNELLAFLTENCCEGSAGECVTPQCPPDTETRPRKGKKDEKVPRPSRRR